MGFTIRHDIVAYFSFFDCFTYAAAFVANFSYPDKLKLFHCKAAQNYVSAWSWAIAVIEIILEAHSNILRM
jgi:hypothetical protein